LNYKFGEITTQTLKIRKNEKYRTKKKATLGNNVYKKLLLLAKTMAVAFLPTSEFPLEIPR
jgi:hypothetical protein